MKQTILAVLLGLSFAGTAMAQATPAVPAPPPRPEFQRNGPPPMPFMGERRDERGGMRDEMREKFRNASPEDRQRMREQFHDRRNPPSGFNDMQARPPMPPRGATPATPAQPPSS